MIRKVIIALLFWTMGLVAYHCRLCNRYMPELIEQDGWCLECDVWWRQNELYAEREGMVLS